MDRMSAIMKWSGRSKYERGTEIIYREPLLVSDSWAGQGDQSWAGKIDPHFFGCFVPGMKLVPLPIETRDNLRVSFVWRNGGLINARLGTMRNYF